VVSNEQAKIHIGDKVPLPTSVVQQSTGGVQTSYSYTDIGVLLDVIPVVNPDRTVLVRLKLEVSSLGANLGTSANPAYDIGTRDAQTSMLLHDGETAVLGGLIQDRDSKNRVKIPLLGDIPFLGGLFTTNAADSKSRTDLLLTVTPRILRDWTFPRSVQEVYSGTESVPSGRTPFSVYQARPAPSPVLQSAAVVPTATKVPVLGNAQEAVVPTISTPTGVGN
jgi:general secretion pathway protein D